MNIHILKFAFFLVVTFLFISCSDDEPKEASINKELNTSKEKKSSHHQTPSPLFEEKNSTKVRHSDILKAKSIYAQQCLICHGREAQNINVNEKIFMNALSQQSADEIEKKLFFYKEEHNETMPFELMKAQISNLSIVEIKALSIYISNLK